MCRVSGAQWLIGLHVPVTIVQLLGRWSSAAINRYIQTAPLLQLPAVTSQALSGGSGSIAGTSSAEIQQSACLSSGVVSGASSSVASDLQPVLDQLASLQEEVEALKRAAPPPDGVLVQSLRSRLVHKGRVNEANNPPKKWRTVCGWPYGIRNFLRVVPSDFSEADQCQRCFNPEDNSSSSSSSSSPSGGSSMSADAESSSEVNAYA